MVNNQNFIPITERVHEIRKKCVLDVSILINTYGWDKDRDLRITSMKRLARLMIGLNVSCQYLSGSEQKVIIENIRLPFETNIEIEQYLVANELFIKAGFASSLYFILENVLKEYLRFLDTVSYKKAGSIENVCNCLLDQKMIWEFYRFDCGVFNFLRLIRNTLHNNGVHLPVAKKDKNVSSIQYRNREYIFKEGERIDFVTWDLILDIADDMRALLFHIANNKAIKSIPGMIPDRFAY